MSAMIRRAIARAWASITPTTRGAFHVARWWRDAIPDTRRLGDFDTPAGRMTLDLRTYPDFAMAVGLYEVTTVRALRRLLRSGMHFVDVGANIGYITLVAAQALGTTGRVDAIEPTPPNHERLVRNCQLNAHASIVTRHAVAISDRDEQREIRRPVAGKRNHGNSSFYLAGDVEWTSESVACRRLDDLLAGTSPDVVKIDVEGAEPLVVGGMTRLLTGVRPPAILIEHNPTTSAWAGEQPLRWLADLLALQPRYRVFTVGPRKWVRNPLLDLDPGQEQNLLLRCE